MELQRLAIIVGECAGVHVLGGSALGLAQASLFSEGGTDRNRETPRAWGEGVIIVGGGRTNIYWRICKLRTARVRNL